MDVGGIATLLLVFVTAASGILLPVVIVLELIPATRGKALRPFLVTLTSATLGCLIMILIRDRPYRPSFQGLVLLAAIFGGAVSGYWLGKRLAAYSPKGVRIAALSLSVVLVLSWSSLTASRAGRTANSIEGATKGNLGTLRSALQIYFADHRSYPKDLSELTRDGKYLSTIPNNQVSDSNTVVYISSPVITGTGGWAYVNDPDSPAFGNVYANLLAKDIRGYPWSYY